MELQPRRKMWRSSCVRAPPFIQFVRPAFKLRESGVQTKVLSTQASSQCWYTGLFIPLCLTSLSARYYTETIPGPQKVLYGPRGGFKAYKYYAAIERNLSWHGGPRDSAPCRDDAAVGSAAAASAAAAAAALADRGCRTRARQIPVRSSHRSQRPQPITLALGVWPLHSDCDRA